MVTVTLLLVALVIECTWTMSKNAGVEQCCVVWCPVDGRGDIWEKFRRKSKDGGACKMIGCKNLRRNLVSYNGNQKQVTQQ